jgi:hypothetical protein
LNTLQQEELRFKQETLNKENMNLKLQYEIDIQNFKRVVDEKEYEKQKLLQRMKYEREVLLEDVELQNKI